MGAPGGVPGSHIGTSWKSIRLQPEHADNLMFPRDILPFRNVFGPFWQVIGALLDRALRPPWAVLGSKFLSASLPRPNPTRRFSWPFSPSAMARQRRVALIVAAVAATMLRSTVFVPAPAGKPGAPAAACAAA
eukprot:4083855-Pyramimonas_sp.AAC.1